MAGRRRCGAAAGLAWAALTGQLAWRRIAPGPRTADETLTMVLTSVALPPLATWHWAGGKVASRRVRPPRPAAVFFDRDGTLIEDVPYNGDPGKVRPRPGARQALDRLRKAGLPVAVVSNQSGLARGRLTWDDVAAVNARVEELI